MGGWLSAAFDELEERPWTPVVIDGCLCCTTRDVGRWHVIFGDDISPPFDDAYDIIEWRAKPLYIARNGSDWFLVWGRLRSQTFPFQPAYRVTESTVLVQPFDTITRMRDVPVVMEAEWDSEWPTEGEKDDIL